MIQKNPQLKLRAQLTITGPMGSKKLTINDKIFSSKLNDKNEFQIHLLTKGRKQRYVGHL